MKYSKNINNFSESVVNFINLLAFNFKDVYLMGTMSEKELQYPSDVDLFEDVHTKYKDLRDALQYYQKKLKEVIKNLIDDKDCYISKIILGLDGDKPKKWTVSDFLNTDLSPYIIQHSMIKIDAIKLVDGTYTDFSIVYRLFNNKQLINKFTLFMRK